MASASDEVKLQFSPGGLASPTDRKQFDDGTENLAITGDHGNSSPPSDEDPAVVDERRHKRMLSNRESARRSRQRKQHHLEDMKKQLAQLHSENMEMASRYSIASRHYSQITEENRLLRSHAMELSRRLQRLHHLGASQSHTGGSDMPLGLAPLDSSLPLHMTAYGGLPMGSSMSMAGFGAMPVVPSKDAQAAAAVMAAFSPGVLPQHSAMVPPPPPVGDMSSR